MKFNLKSIVLSILALFSVIVAPGCGQTETFEPVDYVSQLKFDANSNRNSEVVTLHNTVDGDTAHFAGSFGENNIVKARFLGIDTPESTGKVQPWGVKASNFTKNILKTATSIMIESSSDTWELDSTGDRYLLWIWYKNETYTDWRLLNLEILQEGYSNAKGVSETIYGDVLFKALNQAIKLKLNVHSGEPDPDFFYDYAIQVTLKEIRKNTKEYEQKIVSFDCLVARVAGQTAYVEEYDVEDDKTYGIQVYMGYTVYPFIKQGNRCNIIGTVQYYEGGGTYQISGLTWMQFQPNYKYNSKLLSEGHEVTPHELTADELNDSTKAADMLHTNVVMNNLKVVDVYTTTSGNSTGAMTLTCQTEDNKQVSVRTEVIYVDRESGIKLVEADVLNKTINVHGIVDKYNNEYQIRVFKLADITFLD